MRYTKSGPTAGCGKVRYGAVSALCSQRWSGVVGATIRAARGPPRRQRRSCVFSQTAAGGSYRSYSGARQGRRIPVASHGGLRAWESGAPILIGRVPRPVHRGVDAASFTLELATTCEGELRSVRAMGIGGPNCR